MPHPDLEELLSAVIPFAQQMLSEQGEFYPFGATVSSSGEVEAVGAAAEDEQPESQKLIDLLVSGMREQAAAGQIRAGAVCLDVRVVPPGETAKSDAICTRLEHADGEAIETFLPYRKGLLGRYKYGELFAAAGDRTIFPAKGEGVSDDDRIH
jgi:hypothetical protein